MRWLTMGLAALMVAGFTIVGATQPVPHPEEYLAVSDKPCEMAQAAQEDAEAEQEETYLYEQSYGVETYNSYWYESDDAEAEAAAKEWIAWRESGGDYNAQNGKYYGKYQLQIDMLDGDLSPENQEETAERYVMERYGSWENAREFWNNNGWY